MTVLVNKNKIKKKSYITYRVTIPKKMIESVGLVGGDKVKFELDYFGNMFLRKVK